MTVQELRAELAKFDPNMTVIVTEHSDYSDAFTVGVVEAVRRGSYVEHYYPYQYRNQAPPQTEKFLWIG